MKFLIAMTMILLATVGCGGYGSGMGSTPAPVPAIAPAPGMFATPLTVTITDSLMNATIYFTTDGSTPTLSSRVYQGPFQLTQTGQVTVRAIAAAGGYSTSTAATANFTLQ
jgi:hypothetical protein